MDRDPAVFRTLYPWINCTLHIHTARSTQPPEPYTSTQWPVILLPLFHLHFHPSCLPGIMVSRGLFKCAVLRWDTGLWKFGLRFSKVVLIIWSLCVFWISLTLINATSSIFRHISFILAFKWTFFFLSAHAVRLPFWLPALYQFVQLVY